MVRIHVRCNGVWSQDEKRGDDARLCNDHEFRQEQRKGREERERVHLINPHENWGQGGNTNHKLEFHIRGSWPKGRLREPIRTRSS